MNCTQAQELLPLYASGELDRNEASRVNLHLQECTACGKFHESLESNQTLLRSLRREAVTPASISQMRGTLFARLENPNAVLGWRIRFERFLLSGLRRPRYAVAGLAMALVVCLVPLAEMGRVSAGPVVMERPDFSGWKVVDPTTHDEQHSFSQAYINPAAYKVFAESGKFPEGTTLILASKTSGGALLASVKDNKFAGGWGYFEFKNDGNNDTAKAAALPESAGCFACHRDRAATDHVFTQFYPVLRTVAGVL